METGASTSCFYPLETEKALKKIAECSFNKTEIFFNTIRELDDGFVKELKNIADGSGVKICSIHPFSSFMETNCLFGNYKRRFEDIMKLYERYCEVCNILGCNIVVIHGASVYAKNPVSDELYFERFSELCEMGKKYGVRFCQENVNNHLSQSIDFCKKLRSALGEDFNMVFDVKQSVRAKQNTFEFLNEFKNDIVHIHISDNSKNADCMPPGRGEFDFKRLFSEMENVGYNGEYMIEIYSNDYNVEKELKKSKEYLSKL